MSGVVSNDTTKAKKICDNMCPCMNM